MNTKNEQRQAPLPYRNVVQAGNMVFISGQLPINPATGEIIDGGVQEQTLQVFNNIRTRLGEVGIGLDNVVKMTVFIDSMDNFATMNEVYAAQFTTGIFPARSCIAVRGIPKGALVEIEVIAYRNEE